MLIPNHLPPATSERPGVAPSGVTADPTTVDAVKPGAENGVATGGSPAAHELAYARWAYARFKEVIENMA